MTPADILRPYLLEADRRKPHLRIDNRFPSCFELLEDALALAALGGHDFRFIGKTTAMDGAAFRPAWFTVQHVNCTRPDGQTQIVQIDGLGMDAAWYMPTLSQVKVIANSTANELPFGDPRRGPANLSPYMIPEFNPDTQERQWRWHNPPMPQRGGVIVAPMPTPGPEAPPRPSGILDKPTALARLTQLNDFYALPAGLNRPGGMFIDGHVDLVAVAQWFYQMVVEGRSFDDVVAQIKTSYEYKTKHPNG